MGTDCSDIEKIFKRIENDRIFLKMDIEGSEYDVIEDVLTQHKRITGMVIEFHNINSMYDEWLEIIKKIMKNFNLIHIHANNFGKIGDKKIPDVFEITFENKSYNKSMEKDSNHTYPIKKIDSPNNPKINDYELTFIIK
jgi:hypothetical protein